MKHILYSLFFIPCFAFGLENLTGDKIDNVQEIEIINNNMRLLDVDKLDKKPGDIIPKRGSTYKVGSDTDTFKEGHFDNVYSGGVRLSTSTNIAYTPWTSYTPTYSSGWGSITSANVFYRIIGDTMDIRGEFQMGTVGASAGTITLPTGYVIDS